jgi:phenylacetyl-CoA:acceptor oxidoreductase subunit 1
MPRYIMTADLRRCIGCQTCTASCRQTNATPPGVQWRQVLDVESGEYPDVRRSFIPVGCQHCGDPPCMHVCPTTATYQRDDGLVEIDYEKCIGCGYCAVACPYQARHITHRIDFAYGSTPMVPEEARFDARRMSVATKCTFCMDRVDAAKENGLTPGVDPEVTPACVNSCIAGVLAFGDKQDPHSNVSKLLDETRHFRMHEELGTDPGFYYIWDKK